MKSFDEAVETVCIGDAHNIEQVIRRQAEYITEVLDSPVVQILSESVVRALSATKAVHHKEVLMALFCDGIRLGVCIGIEMEKQEEP